MQKFKNLKTFLEGKKKSFIAVVNKKIKEEKNKSWYNWKVNRIFNLLEKHVLVEFISKIKDEEENTIG